MRRSPHVIVAWIAAIVVALTTVRIVGGDLAALQRRARTLGPDVRVLLATHDLPVGRTITPADVRFVTRPASTVAADTLHDLNQAQGRVVAIPVLRDDPVGARNVAHDLDGVVPAGRRVVHVASKDGYQPPPGAIVDVLATFDPAAGVPGGGRGAATVVAHGARVLTADDPGESGDPGHAGVTLLVTEAEAPAVAYAATIGDLTLALAPPETACCTSPTS
jgi:Flp pilus assembly protein CpaB